MLSCPDLMLLAQDESLLKGCLHARTTMQAFSEFYGGDTIIRAEIALPRSYPPRALREHSQKQPHGGPSFSGNRNKIASRKKVD